MTRQAITTVKTVVESIASGGPGIKIYTLVDPDHWELPPFAPGAHIDLHLPNRLVRTYSLCNDPADNARYVIAVKREDSARGGSIVLHDQVRVGDPIGVSLPRGGLALAAPAARYVFVAGGIGITPFLSAALWLQRTGHADFTLHAVARGPLPLGGLLAPLLANGRVIRHDTRETGRPDIAALVGAISDHTMIGCCGPDTMIADFENAAASWPQANVHIERFVPPPLCVDPDARPYMLVLARSGREIAVGPGQTMLAALEASGADMSSSCCGGICGACKVGWIEGKPIHRDRVLSPYERERFLMACVAGSESDRLVLDL